MSVTPIRPPGRRTRAISRNTAGLSAARLMTQLLMTTSTESAGSGIASIVALEELDVRGAGLGRVPLGEREHLVGHVEADGAAGRPDALRRQEHVDAAARTEVEDALAFVELGDRDRVAAAERGEDGGLRASSARSSGGVQLGAEVVSGSPEQQLPAHRLDRGRGIAGARPPRGSCSVVIGRVLLLGVAMSGRTRRAT